MHCLFEKASGLTGEVIGAAIEVHRIMGPGLIESVYEWRLIREMTLRGFKVSNQQLVRIEYKGACRDEPLRCDVLVEDCVLVEVKAVEAVAPIAKTKLLSYMKLMDVPLGLLINFHVEKLTDGVSRLILPGAPGSLA
jgi:GxxExxY protein